MEKRPDKSPATADRYADVILPLAAPAMTFAVPDAMLRQIVPGCRVIVQLGARKYYTGIVDRLHGQRPPFDRIKPVGRIADAEPVATAEQLRLWHWLSEYYMCPLGMVLRAALPAGLKSDGFSEDETFGRGYMQPRQTVVSLHPDIRNEERLHVALDSLSRAKSQYKALLEYLEKTGNPDFGAPIEIPRKRLSAPTAILKALAEKRFIRIADTEIPASDAPAAPDKLPELSAAQTAAYERIKTCFSEKEVVLLHGVTGSGKTEIYIRLMAEALAAGHNVLYMLPEIALTAQLIRRMESYFGKAVTVYHSRLSDNRRAAVYHELLRCDGGRIVIGVRSSVLLPLRNLSLVIVDEEHDTSFKQTDSAPRYHGRDTAVVLASVCGAKVLLGSATPCAESFHNAVTGKYGHVVLSERYGGVTLPQVIVSDTLRAAKRGEKYSHFNKILLDQIDRTLQRGRQAMLFQNRRGFSPYVECGHCGWTGVCPDCNVSLTYHKNDGTLRCHYCGYHMPIPKTCPSCGTGELLPQGFGTEKIEEELAAIFPQAAIERLDADTARSSRNYRRIIASFEQRKTNILVGTQIITKGFDFGGVALVGILNADNMLNYPDFRAGERAFQMMMQVGGRAGRREKQGTVVIQTAQPEHPVVRQARDSDYDAMIRSQLAERRAFFYPPFCRLIAVLLRHRDHALLWKAAAAFGTEARTRFGRRLLGPEPPAVDRIRGQFRLQFLLKIEKQLPVAAVKKELSGLFDRLHAVPEFRPVDIVVDVDPQ